MNILLINHYAGSFHHGMEYRPYYFAREWVRLGHQVTIAAASYSHVRTQQPEVSDQKTVEQIDGIRYVWCKTPYYQGNGVKRGLNILVFVVQLARIQGVLTKPHTPDVIIGSSTHPLDIIPAKFMAKKIHAKLIYEVHDLWPLSLVELGGMSPNHPFILLMQWAENYAYRNADIVISMLPEAKQHMSAHGMGPGKFVYIPNGVDMEEYQPCQETIPQAHAQAIAEQKKREHFLVCYAGAHGLANSLNILLKAAALLKDQAVTFVLVGQGPEKAKLQQMALARGLDNVLFLPPVAKKVIPTLLNEMDGLFISLKRKPLFRFGVSPNKLMDYMMAEKPVIYAIDAGNDLVAESGCGISVPPENPDAIVDAVIRLMNMPVIERVRMGSRGHDYVMTHHDYRILAQRVLESVSPKGDCVS